MARNHHQQQEAERAERAAEFSDLVRALPTAEYSVPSTPKSEEEPDACCVCLDEFNNGDITRTLSCAHIYHAECIDAWLVDHRDCPLCKDDVFAAVSGKTSDNSLTEDPPSTAVAATNPITQRLMQRMGRSNHAATTGEQGGDGTSDVPIRVEPLNDDDDDDDEHGN